MNSMTDINKTVNCSATGSSLDVMFSHVSMTAQAAWNGTSLVTSPTGNDGAQSRLCLGNMLGVGLQKN